MKYMKDIDRPVMDAINIDNDNRIFFNSVACATYTSRKDENENHKNVEDVLDDLENLIVEKSEYISSQYNDKISNLWASVGEINDRLNKDTNLENIRSVIEFYEGHVEIESINSVPINKRLCIANIRENSNLSMADIPSDGKEIHIIVRNVGTKLITVALPNSGNYICIGNNAYDIDGGSYIEINVISDGDKMYIRANK